MPVKRLYSLCSTLLCVLITAGNLYGITASPRTHELAQPDGSVINARQWGDEWLHGWETIEGYTIVKDKAGFWFYAGKDSTGKLFPTNIRADKPVPEGQQRFARPGGKLARKALRNRDEAPSKVVPSTGAAKISVILINFNDTTTTNTPTEFESLLFDTNPSIATGPGSMKDYYEEVSYGAFSVSSGPSGVSGWHTATAGHDYYGTSSQAAAELVREAVLAADAAGFDFSQYDNDGDGKVDVVNIVHQGSGEEAGGVATDIWSHRWSLTYAGVGSVSVDGVSVDDYIIQPERLYSGMTTMGIYTHEFGHALGLPDLYDTDYSSSGIGKWCLMAGGSWNYTIRSGDSPAHMSAWCKYFMGWITPTSVSGTLTDEPIDQTASIADVYQLLSGSPTSGEYFLVENRQKTGFDYGLPGDGLLIWHIDGTVTSNNYECYPTGPSCTSNHYGVALVQADSLWELEKNVNRGDDGDPYPGSTNNMLFTDSWWPNSNLYNGNPSTVGVLNISASGSQMTATLFVGGGSISGKVTVDPGGEGIENAWIYVYDDGGSWAGYDYTDFDGNYTVYGLLTGNYYVSTGNYQGYLNEWYDNVSSQADATLVHVDAPNNTPDIDFALVFGGVITTTTTTPPSVPCKITINPESGTVIPGETIQFSARVSGENCAVADPGPSCYTWEVTMKAGDTGGTVDADGLYTAGSDLGTETITVTDTCNSDITAEAIVEIVPCKVSIEPPRITVSPGQIQKFTASSQGEACEEVEPLCYYTWSVNAAEATGNTGNTFIYQAGPVGTEIITVTDTCNGGISETAVVTIEASPPTTTIPTTTPTTAPTTAPTTTPTTIPTPPPTTTISIPECEEDEDCDDGMFCNGEESCVKGRCRSGDDPCTEDDLFCNGEEFCDETNDICRHSGDPCQEDTVCSEEDDECLVPPPPETTTTTSIPTTSSSTTTTPEETVDITPQSLSRSRWILLPAILTIQGTNTEFEPLSSTVSCNPSTSVLPILTLVFDSEMIVQLIFIMPPWLAGGAEAETVTVTVTTETEVVSNTFAIEMLPFTLDELQGLK